MIRLDFGEFAVNMRDAEALAESLFGNADPAINHSASESTSGEANFTIGGEAGRIRMLGTFGAPPAPSDLVSEFTIFSDNFATVQLYVTPAPDLFFFDTVFND